MWTLRPARCAPGARRRGHVTVSPGWPTGHGRSSGGTWLLRDRERTGVPRTRSLGGGEAHHQRLRVPGLEGYGLHDARHCWAVRIARAGTPFELVARQLGHRDVAM